MLVLIIIVGLFALIAGKLTITKNLRLSGKNARIYGALLLVLCVPCFLFGWLLLFIIPPSIFSNVIVMTVFNLVLVLCLVIGLAIPFREK